MAEYLSQKELVKAIETNLNNLEAGQLNLSEIEEHLNLVRELYERTIVLRYKAFEHYSAVEVVVPTAEEVVPVIEAQESHEEEVLPEADFTETSGHIEFEPGAGHTEIEFDFFSPDEETEEKSQETGAVIPSEKEEVVNPDQQGLEEEKQKTEEDVENNIEINRTNTPVETVAPSSENTPATSTSGFSGRIFEIEREIRNQIGFNSLPTLIGSFGLNERLLYINELFDGSSESFSEAIKHLDSRSNLADTTTFIEETAEKFNWDIESETVEEFIQKLCRRYA